MTPEETENFCRIVGVLLVSDTELHDSELVYLDDLFDRLEVAPDQRRAIQAKINIDDDIEALALALSPETRAQLLEELHTAAWADGVVVRSESTIIKTIEELLDD